MLTSQGATTYQYNGDGVLVAQTISGTTTRFTQDLARPLPQMLQITSGGGRTDVVYGLERLGSLRGGAWTWTVGDALGSVRVLLPRAGTPGRAQTYDAWGVPGSGGIASFGFTGEYTDQALVYLRARWYDPRTGRFGSRDAFAGWPERPYSQHPYQYAYGDPVRWTDPSGRDPLSCLLISQLDSPAPGPADAVSVACLLGEAVVAVGALFIAQQQLRDLAPTNTANPPPALPPLVPGPTSPGPRPPVILADPVPDAAGSCFQEEFPLTQAPHGPYVSGEWEQPIQLPPALTVRKMSDILDANMRAAGIVRPPGTAAHHVVAWDDRRAAIARAILAREGIGINEAVNGVYLPKDKHFPTVGNARHSDIHSNRYHTEVERRLSIAARGTIRTVLGQIRREIERGTFPK